MRLIFRPISQIQTFEGGLFSYGGAIFNFSQKIDLKSIKNMRFCILHKPMGGGLEPPPAPPPPPPWLRYWLYCRSRPTLQSKVLLLFFLYVPENLINIPEVESRTQGSRPRPRTQKNFNAKAKDRPSRGQGQRRKCSPKKRSSKIFFRRKRSSKNFFTRSPREENKKMSSQIFREVSGVFQQNFNSSKNSAVLEPRTGQFSRTWGFEAKDFKMCPRGRPRDQGRPQGLHLCNIL